MNENLLGFPLSLVWGAVAALLYRPGKISWAIRGGFAFLCVASLFLPEPWRTHFWLPGGSAIVLLTVILSLEAFSPDNLLQRMISIDLPSRLQIRDTLLKTDDPERKREMYMKIVMDYSRLWVHRDHILTRPHTLQLLAILLIVHAIGFTYLALDYISRPVLSNQLAEVLPKAAQLFENDGVNVENFAEMARSYLLQYAGGYTFLQNSITILLTLFTMRVLLKRRTGASLPVGSLNLFRMPEYAVWLFLGACILPLVSFRLQVPTLPNAIAINLVIIMGMLYVMHGIGILSVFLEVRLMPSNWIFMGIMLITMFIPYVAFFFLGGMGTLGLADFFFDFRKRALQPVQPSI